ncbi:hypothetical protein L6452_27468 [Arctium lappa]|uniref:Uncharacterized protein n=1 Tax=Arctium lappa TaxID=4217 RepID=A0ACB8ZWD3_ARCLA|nr:hypothetical protein L6452_27468 [Arctium lappa]
MSFNSVVPENQRPCGTLRPIPELIDGFPAMPKLGDSSGTDAIFPDILKLQDPVTHPRSKSFSAVKGLLKKRQQGSPSMNSEDSVTTTCLDGGFDEYSYIEGGREVHLLNLFK